MYEFDELSEGAQVRAVSTVRHALYSYGFDPTETLTMQIARDAYYAADGMYLCRKANFENKKPIERQLKSAYVVVMCLF